MKSRSTARDLLFLSRLLPAAQCAFYVAPASCRLFVAQPFLAVCFLLLPLVAHPFLAVCCIYVPVPLASCRHILDSKGLNRRRVILNVVKNLSGTRSFRLSR